LSFLDLEVGNPILSGAVLDPTSNMGGQAFALSMTALWENALRQMLGELASRVGLADRGEGRPLKALGRRNRPRRSESLADRRRNC
jgi:hypothetical protein